MPNFLFAALKVLAFFKRPLSVDDIVDTALRNNYLRSAGKTPTNTMRARISEDIRKNDILSTFIRVGPNKFALREWNVDEYSSRPFIKAKNGNVVCIKSSVINGIKPLFGFSKQFKPYFSALKIGANILTIPRSVADTRNDIKQLVSYVLLKDHQGKFLSYIRGNYSAIEHFLKGVLCIGFGGHVKDTDLYNLFGYSNAGIFTAATREVYEELKGITPSNLHLIGVINDDSSFLGLRHFAFVFEGLLPVTFSLNKKTERSVNKLDFLDSSTLWKRFHELEFWSQLLCKSLIQQPLDFEPVIINSNKKKISDAPLIIVGEIGSGKTEISSFLSRKFNVPLIFSRTCVAEVIKMRDFGNAQRKEFQKKALEFVNRPDGSKQLALSIIDSIKAISSPIVIIDGIRHLTTLEILKKHFPQLLVMYVDAPRDQSFFLYKRRCNRDVSISEFRESREHPVEKEISLLRSRSDVYIFNDGTLKQLCDKVSNWWKEHVKK